MKKTNNKPKHLRIKRLAITTCLLTALSSTSALAIDPLNPGTPESSVVEAIEKARVEIIANLKAAKDQLNVLFLNAFSGVLTAQAQQPNIALQDPAGKYKFTETDEAGKNQTPVPPYDLVSEASQKAAAIKLQNSLSNENVKTQRRILLQPPSTDKNAVANMLDAQNFLGPLAYTPEAQNNAERVVSFLSDYAGPLGSIDLEKLDAKPDLRDSEAGREYRVKVYTSATARSLLLGNLYDSFNKRVPIAGLAQQSGMSNTPNASASLAEVEKYLASRRIKNADWYKTINDAPSIAVQREIAFTLAEMQWQLYQLHRDNEKILQTMTAVGVLNLRSSAAFISPNEIDLKQELEGTKMKGPEDIPASTQYTPPPSPEGGIPTIPQ
jgi:hypothetical protein